MHRVVDDTAAMEELGRELGAVLRGGDLVVLTGPLGAGKTTLTRGLAEALGVRGRVQSPTFVLARTHPSLGDGPPLVHVDAYRLGGADELLDLDLDFARAVVVVEWGAGLLDGVAESWLEVVIDRPSGADHTSDPATGATASDRASGGGSGEAHAGDDAEPLDAEALDDDEPRMVRITGFGPRWAASPYAVPA